MEKLIALLTLLTGASLLAAAAAAVDPIFESRRVTKLHFYLQDFIGGDKPTVWEVARSNLTDELPSLFGMFLVFDDLVTSGPDVDSGEVGRLQGTAGLADLREEALVMVLNLVFTRGEYEGSTLSILGRNPLWQELREASIVGGTGAFRMASGYILMSTYFDDPARVRSVYEYNAVVYHFHPSLSL